MSRLLALLLVVGLLAICVNSAGELINLLITYYLFV